METLESRPELEIDQAELLSSYMLLNNCRQQALGGLGTIPLSDIVVVFHEFGWDEAMSLREFVGEMMALDAVHREHDKRING